jgi:hypothetical protein
MVRWTRTAEPGEQRDTLRGGVASDSRRQPFEHRRNSAGDGIEWPK